MPTAARVVAGSRRVSSKAAIADAKVFGARAVAPKAARQTVVTEAALKVAINGFGRIGRNFLRCWHGRKDTLLDVVAVNDSGGVKQASHLLKYDSTLGVFGADVQIVDDTHFSVDGKVITVVSNRDPTQLPWAELGIDIVIEGTGVFLTTEGAGKHLEAGAKKVVITAPGKGDVPTYVVGVNERTTTRRRTTLCPTPPAPPTASLPSSRCWMTSSALSRAPCPPPTPTPATS